MRMDILYCFLFTLRKAIIYSLPTTSLLFPCPTNKLLFETIRLIDGACVDDYSSLLNTFNMSHGAPVGYWYVDHRGYQMFPCHISSKFTMCLLIMNLHYELNLHAKFWEAGEQDLQDLQG